MLPAIRNLWIAGLSVGQIAALVDLVLYGDVDEAPDDINSTVGCAVAGCTDEEARVRLAIANTILTTARLKYEELNLAGPRLTDVL